MGSASIDPRRMQRRDSSPRCSSKRRPKLLRAAATEPSITTSNACRNALANQSCGRATDLLNRVAYVSGSPPDSAIRSASPLSARAPMYDRIDRQTDLSTSPSNHSEGAFEEDHPRDRWSHLVDFPDHMTDTCSDSGRYFSFPSFDIYEAGQQDEEKDAAMKSP